MAKISNETYLVVRLLIQQCKAKKYDCLGKIPGKHDPCPGDFCAGMDWCIDTLHNICIEIEQR